MKWPNDLTYWTANWRVSLVELTGKCMTPAQIVIGAGINMAMRRVEEDVINQDDHTREAGITLDRNMLAVQS